jgi:hypothetical protein
MLWTCNVKPVKFADRVKVSKPLTTRFANTYGKLIIFTGKLTIFVLFLILIRWAAVPWRG